MGRSVQRRDLEDTLRRGGPAGHPAAPPRWYAHSYNRAAFYRMAAALAWLPRRARLGLARAIGRAAPRFLPAERAVVGSNLAVMAGATGSRLDELTAEVFGEFAMVFSDLVSTNREPVARLLGRVGPLALHENLRPLDGAVISLTAHVGNWDLAGRFLARHSSRPTHVVVAVEEVPALERWLRRDGDGVRFVPRSAPTISLGLLAALRRGEAVAFQGDRALGNRGDIPVPFFGRPAPFPVGPFRLASASAAPVVPAFCTLGADRRYAVSAMEPFTVKPGGEEEALRAWVGILEGIVRARPTQWFNFFDIWNPFAG
jgi:lauroyl/myristoyl acyltransferase